MKKKFLFLSLLIVAMTVGAVGAWASQTKTGQRSSVEAMASPESATNTETSSNGSRPLKSMYTFLNVTHFFENAGFDDDLTFQADGSMQTAASTETSISGQSWAYIAPDGTVYARPKASSPKSRSDGRKMDAVNGFWGQMAGWELTTTATYPNCEWSYYGAIPYSLGATAVPIGDDSDQFLIVPEKPEALNTDDNTGVLMLSAGWGGSATYSQTVYLPAGLSVTVDYWLKATNEKETQYGEVTCRLINNGKVICSKTGYTYEWQHYKMSGVDGSGPTTIEFSFKAGNAGSNSNPIIWIDGLHVEKNIIYNPSEHKEIHVSPSNNKYGKVAGNRTILQGMDTIVKAIPNVGYQFMNWTSNGEVVSTEREFKFTVSRDTTLVANFVPDAQEQYTMTFVLDNGEENVVLIQDAGTELTPPTPTRTGYTFVGWEPAVPTTVPEEDRTFIAQWKELRKVWNFRNGFSQETVDALRTDFEQYGANTYWRNYEIEASNADDQHFWCASQEAKNEDGFAATHNGGNEKVIAELDGLKLGFTAPKKFVITYNGTTIPNELESEGGPALGEPIPHGTSYIWLNGKNETITFQAMVNQKIRIGVESHSVDATKLGEARGITLSASKGTLTAHFEGNPVTTYYTEYEWELTGEEGTVSDLTIKSTSGCHIYFIAVGEISTTFVLGNGQDNVVLLQDAGTELTPPTPTRTGYTFAGWSPAVPATVPEEDMTFTAQWTVVDYSISYDLGGGSWPEGSAHPASYNIESEAITLGTPTRTGYTFTGWTGTELTEASQTVTIAKGSTGNRSYTANWVVTVVPQYTMTFVLGNGEENVVMTQDTGTELTAPTPTRTGYTFAGWEPAVPATVPEEDMTFTAQWTVVDYSISYDLGGGSWPEGSAHPASYNIESEAITLGTPTRTGYTFTGWTGTELTEASQTVTIAKGSTGNRSYTATWEAIPEPSIDEFSLNNGTLVNLVDALKGKSAKVSYTRNFSNGVASTICLPYTMTNIEGGKVYSLRNVAYDYTAAAWVATMDDTTPDGNLIATTEAGMPYLFVPETDGNVTFTGIVPTVPDSYAAFSLVNATSNGWVMTGTYEQLDWTESMGAIFGFAANAENDVRAGEFVRATTGAYIPAYRAYLRYTGSNEALQSRAFKVQNANDPQRVIVRLVSKGGETTDIATMKVDMLNDKWYTLDGRMVNGQPTKKGLYILNGKKVRVK